jgi:hypothetical protein
MKVSQQLWQVRGAHLTLSDTALGINEHRKGQAARGVAQGLAQFGAAKTGQRNLKLHRFALQKLAHGRGPVDGQAQHLAALFGKASVKGVQLGHLFHAGRAPSRPEVDQQRAALQAAHQKGLPSQGVELLGPKVGGQAAFALRRQFGRGLHCSGLGL